MQPVGFSIIISKIPGELTLSLTISYHLVNAPLSPGAPSHLILPTTWESTYFHLFYFMGEETRPKGGWNLIYGGGNQSCHLSRARADGRALALKPCLSIFTKNSSFNTLLSFVSTLVPWWELSAMGVPVSPVITHQTALFLVLAQCEVMTLVPVQQGRVWGLMSWWLISVLSLFNKSLVSWASIWEKIFFFF